MATSIAVGHPLLSPARCLRTMRQAEPCGWGQTCNYVLSNVTRMRSVGVWNWAGAVQHIT